MNTAQVFSYSLLIKSPERTEKILALLEDAKREEVMKAIAGLQGLSPEDLRRVWREQRKAEEVMVRESIRDKAGAQLEKRSAPLAEWLVRKSLARA